MPRIIGILTCMSMIVSMLSYVELEKSFITSGPGWPTESHVLTVLYDLDQTDTTEIDINYLKNSGVCSCEFIESETTSMPPRTGGNKPPEREAHYSGCRLQLSRYQKGDDVGK